MLCPLILLYSLAGNTVLQPSPSFVRKAPSPRSAVLAVHRRLRPHRLILLRTRVRPRRSATRGNLNLVRQAPRDLVCFNRAFPLVLQPADFPRTCPGSAVSSSSSTRNSG